MAADEEKKTKDKWDKVDVIFRPLNGLLTALAVGLLGYYTSTSLRERETNQTNERVYTELMSSRELAESGLRKDMFLSIIQTFMQPTGTLEGKMLNLEMLAYNFHESLNLKPLFSHMSRQLGMASGSPAEKKAMDARLKRVAVEITTRQIVLLKQVGKDFSQSVDLEMLRKTPGGIDLEPKVLQLDRSRLERQFTLTVLKVDNETNDLTMELKVQTTDKSNPSAPAATSQQSLTFHLGFFDFPMIDNTRLSEDQRAAVVLNQMGQDSADVTLVLFPGAYASLKERVSYEEVLQNLRSMGANGK